MSELARTIAGRLREYFGNRRHEKRQDASLPLSVSLTSQSISRNGSPSPQSIDGHTLDISSIGLSLVVPAMRIGEHYLTGEAQNLRVRLELPGGPVEIQARPVRYESLEEHKSETGYLIGVVITQMNEVDRARYLEYVNHLAQK